MLQPGSTAGNRCARILQACSRRRESMSWAVIDVGRYQSTNYESEDRRRYHKTSNWLKAVQTVSRLTYKNKLGDSEIIRKYEYENAREAKYVGSVRTMRAKLNLLVAIQSTVSWNVV